MTSHRARISIVSFLLIVGVAGAYLGFDTYRRHEQVFAHEREVLARLDMMLASVNELAVTQRGYFEPDRGQRSGNASSPQFERVRQLTDELKEHLTVLRTQVTEPAALDLIGSLASALDDFSTTDTRARTNLANDTLFSAADLVFSASAAELRSVTSALIALKDLNTKIAISQYEGLQARMARVVGAVGVVWTLGLLMLAWPAARSQDQQENSALAATELPTPNMSTPSKDAAAGPAQLKPAIDLGAVARACASMAKATSATELREVMAEAASAAGVGGMIVWLGAGEELFPVLGHGYDPRMLSRIGPLARQAANATALAWRSADTQIVAGEEGRAGAIVVPLVSTQGCIGVLSAEVSSGGETNPDTLSAATLFAAQLSTVVAAWPEPSAGGATGHAPQPGTMAITL